jgi:hypothetical protein
MLSISFTVALCWFDLWHIWVIRGICPQIFINHWTSELHRHPWEFSRDDRRVMERQENKPTVHASVWTWSFQLTDQIYGSISDGQITSLDPFLRRRSRTTFMRTQNASFWNSIFALTKMNPLTRSISILRSFCLLSNSYPLFWLLH